MLKNINNLSNRFSSRNFYVRDQFSSLAISFQARCLLSPANVFEYICPKKNSLRGSVLKCCLLWYFLPVRESLTEFFSPWGTKRRLRWALQLQLNTGDYQEHHSCQTRIIRFQYFLTKLETSGTLASPSGWKPERNHPRLPDLYPA